MKFNAALNEAVLIRRILGFMAEVVLPSKRKLLVRCPITGDLKDCDVLGSKIWYSNAIGFEDLHTWEVTEVDDGHMVCINSEHIADLVIEGITNGVITELQDYSLLQTNAPYIKDETIDILLEEGAKQCYMHLEPVFLTNEKNNPVCFEGKNIDKVLKKLIALQQEGHRVVLFFCVQHTGVNNIKIMDNLSLDFSKLLKQACQDGLELLAYKTSITEQGMSLIEKIPVELSEKISH